MTEPPPLMEGGLEISCPHCHKTHKIYVREAYLDAALKDALALSSAEIGVDAR